MPKRYAKILDTALNQSEKTLREISAECKDYGIEVSPSSLSKMRTGEQLPPPEMVKSEVLSLVLDIPSSPFVVAAVLEHTPKELLTLLARGSIDDMVRLHELAKEIVGERGEGRNLLRVRPFRRDYPRRVALPDDEGVHRNLAR